MASSNRKPFSQISSGPKIPRQVRATYRSDAVAEPEHIDEGLARFGYTFPDGSHFKLNMFPLRKNYMRRLIREAGFASVKTYGDFQETYQETDPDFFVHVAEKHMDHPDA
jgi:hypothetical protein